MILCLKILKVKKNPLTKGGFKVFMNLFYYTTVSTPAVTVASARVPPEA